ncbi:MAG: AsmA-like C-terminal domain-containing protein [Sulfurovum sp.]|nr:AsmA-like C-terminal domain-containing protein [Sulfurovum sp.]
MIKTSAIFSAHLIHVLVRNTLIFFFVLFLAFFIWLRVGIKLDTLKVGDYQISGLYIKLDKKLTLIADHITIPKSKEEPSFKNIDETFDNIKYLFTFFNYIELEKVVFKDNHMNMIFTDDILYMNNDRYEIAGNIHRLGETLEAEISMLYWKEEDVEIHGKLLYDLNTEGLKTEGTFSAYGIQGSFFANKIDNTVDFDIQSDKFNDLHPIITKLNSKEIIRSWVLDKVEAETYKLLSLKGKANVSDGKFEMDVDALRTEVLFSNVKIHFKEDVAPVIASNFVLSYKNEGVFFELKLPTYKNKSLEGSRVSVVNIMDNNITLKLHIEADTPFDKVMQDLIKSYGIHIAVKQTSGKMKAVFLAEIGLKNDYSNFILDVNFTKGDVWLDKVRLPIVKGILHYEKGFISLHDLYIKDKMVEGILEGKMDLDKKKANFVFDAKDIKFKSKKETIFSLKNEKFPFVLTYKKDITIDIIKFALELHHKKKETTLRLKDLSKIKKYLAKSIPLERNGNIKIKTKDFKTYTFQGMVNRKSCFLYEKKNQCKTKVPFKGKIIASDIELFAFNKRIHYNKSKSRIKLKNLNIDLEKFLAIQKKDAKEKGNSLTILGKNSHLRYGDYRLILDSYDVTVKKNGDIKAIGSASGDIIKFSKKTDIVNVQAFRITDKVLHPMINFKGLHKGRYTLKSTGNPKKTMEGEVIVEGGVMKDFKVYNNTLAFINTLPALVALQKPGFSTEGFIIEEGVVEYRRIGKDMFIFDSIYIKGASATIVGKGKLDLKNNMIDMNLAIQVARKLGNVLGSIPVLGYILMGKDKSVTVGLKITGSLDKPSVTTTGVQEMLLLPLDILKRTLESPAHILNK